MNAHPEGCRRQVEGQIEYVRRRGAFDGPRNALIVGSSTGYGLASRIVSSFGCGAPTVGVFYERPGTGKRSGSAGYYNSLAFDDAAAAAGITATSINGDAFSDEVKQEAVAAIRESCGTVDLVVYSLAAPVRTDPDTGEEYRSVIKPIGRGFVSKTADPFTCEVSDFEVEPATEEEIASTVKVMGGEDWERWIRLLADEGVLADGATTVAYSYIGPPATQAMYRHGTIGRAKEHLEETARRLGGFLSDRDGHAYVSVNKALVTRASAVIPVVPLYISLLYRVMKEKGIHEDCIEQMYRLFSERLYTDHVVTDEAGRIRMDDYEMRSDVQSAVQRLWSELEDVPADEVADFDGYRETFLHFHGFGVPGVDYEAETTP